MPSQTPSARAATRAATRSGTGMSPSTGWVRVRVSPPRGPTRPRPGHGAHRDGAKPLAAVGVELRARRGEHPSGGLATLDDGEPSHRPHAGSLASKAAWRGRARRREPLLQRHGGVPVEPHHDAALVVDDQRVDVPVVHLGVRDERPRGRCRVEQHARPPDVEGRANRSLPGGLPEARGLEAQLHEPRREGERGVVGRRSSGRGSGSRAVEPSPSRHAASTTWYAGPWK